MHRYSQFVFETVSQSAACNRLHVIEQRAARWLLMSEDRVGRNRFDLTQEFLAEMLGVRRPGPDANSKRDGRRKILAFGFSLTANGRDSARMAA